MLAAVAVTLGVDWVAVVLGTDRSMWASSTALLIGALAVLTLVAAVTAALAFGVAVAGSHQVAEGGGLPLLDAVGVFLLLAWIGTAGMLAFLLAAGWYLRLVRPLDAGPVRVGRPGGLALAAAIAAVPLAVAFRAPLLPFLSAGLASQPAGGVVLLSLGAAVLAGALVFGATSMARRARHGRRSSR